MSVIALAFRYSFCVATIAALVAPPGVAAAEPMDSRIEQLVPALEAYIANGMTDFDAPGLAIGIVTGERLVYGKGFGVRQKGGEPVTTGTVFQIGSTTKAFLATAMAIGVDRELLAWDDRIVDRYPAFQLRDHWVTGEFRLLDILAQRSGLPSLANDMYGMLGANVTQKIASLRHVEPVTSFRAAFGYTNITHLIAGRVVATAFGAAEWSDVLRRELLEPLGMSDTSWTLSAIENAPDHAEGHLWSVDGSVLVGFNGLMPYDYPGAGEINSTVDDMQRWLRLQLGDGVFGGRRLVSSANLATTLLPRVPIRKGTSYAMGWMLQSTPNGEITWHNGGTVAFGTYVGLARDHDVGVVVLSNQTHVGLPDAIGRWTLDQLLGNPEVDYATADLERIRAGDEAMRKAFERPGDARPAPLLAPLAGEWSNPIFGAATMHVDGDAPRLALSTGATLRLDPWDGDVFTIALVPEGEMKVIAESFGPLPLGFAQFRIGATGEYENLSLDFTMETQQYVFARD